MNKINSFTIYREYWDLITLLSDKEQADVLLAMVKYMFDDEEITLSIKENKVFCNLKRPLNKSKNKSKNASKQNQNKIKTKSKGITHHDVNVNVYVDGNKDIYNLKFNFGKYKDCLVSEVFKKDKSYINWIYPRLNDEKLKELIKLLKNPSWYGKEIEEEKASAEDIKKLEERLNGN